MVMETASKHLITQFSDMMHVEAQQSKSRFRPYVTIKQMSGEDFAYDTLADVEATELTGRFNKTVFDDIDHGRRKIEKQRFVITLPIDRDDIESRLRDPQGDYARACVMAMERLFDRVCAAALFADVKTGRDFSTTVTFAADGGLTVDATAGLTYEKLLEGKQNFIDNDVDAELYVFGGTGDEHTALMGEAELTSGDFSRQFVVDKGSITRGLGIDMVWFGANARKPVLDVTGGTRSNFLLAKGGLCVGMAREWDIKIQDRPDYVDTKQVQITGVLGAVRTEGALIQKVTTTD